MTDERLTDAELDELAQDAKAWPFEQARLIKKRVEQHGVSGGAVIFETGYGPSGLPHIGTFGEVARTTMVRHAFRVLTDDAYPTRLIAFSDDLDGMRKVPPGLPNQEMLAEHLGKPLSDVPDPFGTHKSYSAHNNAKLREFLDAFGFEYEFYSATEQYRSGAFDEILLRTLERFDDVMAIMLPTLGSERQATYSPFLPISPATGRVLYVPMKAIDPKAGTITFEDEDGTDVTTSVTGGAAKLQWKPDFGMRWAALGVDFEMFGKDHQANAPIYSRICRTLGVEPPVQFVYELFLDEKGEKISKTKGNGIAVEDWLRYATQESKDFLAAFKVVEALPAVIKELRELRAARDKLQAFKDYVHQRLDDSDIPTHPDGPHSQKGCRIGDRLDIALASCAENARLREALRDVTTYPSPEHDAADAKELYRDTLGGLEGGAGALLQPTKPVEGGGWSSFWCSFYADVPLAHFEYSGPWWVSGEDADDVDIVVAAVRAANERAAMETLRNAYDANVRPLVLRERFCEFKDERDIPGFPFRSGRFRRADWMKWPFPPDPAQEGE